MAGDDDREEILRLHRCFSRDRDGSGRCSGLVNLILDSDREKRKLSSKEREKIYATSLDWNEVILSDKEEEEVKDDYDAQMIDVDFLLGSDLVYDESGVKILRESSQNCCEPDAERQKAVSCSTRTRNTDTMGWTWISLRI